MPKKEKLTFESVWAMFKETDLKFQETDRMLKESAKEAERRAAEYNERMAKFDEQLGYFGRTLGGVSELLLVPGICEKMNVHGHCFTRIGPNKIIRNDRKTLTEIDLMLENGEEAMAVEIKTNLSAKWVNKHLERLKLMRRHENVTGLKGRVLFGAVAGIVIDRDARDLALENGMYVVNIIEDEERLEVAAPEKSNIGRW